MGKTKVYVKANFIQSNFKKLGLYINNFTRKDFTDAIQHKIYVPENEMQSVNSNKKLLSTFYSVRIIGEDKLICLDNPQSICSVIPVDRKDFKAGEELAFENALAKYFSAVPKETMQKTHLQYMGVLNTERNFGIYYTILLPPDYKPEFVETFGWSGETLPVLGDKYDKNVDGMDILSRNVINKFKPVKGESK